MDQRFNFRRFNSRLFEMSGFLVVVVVLWTSCSRFKDSKCDGEVGEDGEGGFTLGMVFRYRLTFHSQFGALLLVPNMLKPQKLCLQ